MFKKHNKVQKWTRDRLMTEPEIIEKAIELLPKKMFDNFSNSKYQLRLSAVESLENVILKLLREYEEKNFQDFPLKYILGFITVDPGFKDNNINVLKKRLEITVLLLTRLREWNKLTLSYGRWLTYEVLGKIGNNKVSEVVKDLLEVICQTVGFSTISKDIICQVKEHKNPRILFEIVKWFAHYLDKFDSISLDITILIDFCKFSVEGKYPNVRSAGIDFAAVLHQINPNAVISMFDDQKKQLQQQLQEKIIERQGRIPRIIIDTPKRRINTLNLSENEDIVELSMKNKIIPNSQKKVIQQSQKKVIQQSQKKNVQNSQKKNVQNSQKKVIQNSQKKIVQNSQKKIVQISQKKIVQISQRKKVEFSPMMCMETSQKFRENNLSNHNTPLKHNGRKTIIVRHYNDDNNDYYGCALKKKEKSFKLEEDEIGEGDTYDTKEKSFANVSQLPTLSLISNELDDDVFEIEKQLKELNRVKNERNTIGTDELIKLTDKCERLKGVMKWDFHHPTDNHLTYLKEQLNLVFGNILNRHFSWSQGVNCGISKLNIFILREIKTESDVKKRQKNIQLLASCTDVIFKVISLECIEVKNEEKYLNCLNFLSKLLDFHELNLEQLTDHEIDSIVPFLLRAIEITPTVTEQTKSILLKIGPSHVKWKVFSHFFFNFKNERLGKQLIVLELMVEFVKEVGLDKCCLIDMNSELPFSIREFLKLLDELLHQGSFTLQKPIFAILRLIDEQLRGRNFVEKSLSTNNWMMFNDSLEVSTSKSTFKLFELPSHNIDNFPYEFSDILNEIQSGIDRYESNPPQIDDINCFREIDDNFLIPKFLNQNNFNSFPDFIQFILSKLSSSDESESLIIFEQINSSFVSTIVRDLVLKSIDNYLMNLSKLFLEANNDLNQMNNEKNTKKFEITFSCLNNLLNCEEFHSIRIQRTTINFLLTVLIQCMGNGEIEVSKVRTLFEKLIIDYKLSILILYFMKLMKGCFQSENVTHIKHFLLQIGCKVVERLDRYLFHRQLSNILNVKMIKENCSEELLEICECSLEREIKYEIDLGEIISEIDDIPLNLWESNDESELMQIVKRIITDLYLIFGKDALITSSSHHKLKQFVIYVDENRKKFFGNFQEIFGSLLMVNVEPTTIIQSLEELSSEELDYYLYNLSDGFLKFACDRIKRINRKNNILLLKFHLRIAKYLHNITIEKEIEENPVRETTRTEKFESLKQIDVE
ncbi:hypothetical protein SNEBB_007125 [Seison nebaliae]|nr:hypothetical protein SNEBB_007125 [Seison nebaliae]